MSRHQHEIDENSEPEDLADHMQQKMGGLGRKGIGEELLRGGLRVGEQMSEQYLHGKASMRGGGYADGTGGVGMHDFGSGDSGRNGRRGYETQRGRPEPGHGSDKAKEGRGLEQIDRKRAGTQGGRLPLNEDSSGHRAREYSGPRQMRGDDRPQGSGSDDVRGGKEGLFGPHSTQDYKRSREQHDRHGSQDRDNRGEEERKRMRRETERYPGMNHNSPERKGDRREKGEEDSGISGSKGPRIGNTGKSTSSKDEESESEEESSDEESDGSSEEGSDDGSGSEADSDEDSSEEKSEDDSEPEEDESGEDSDEESEEDSDDE